MLVGVQQSLFLFFTGCEGPDTPNQVMVTCPSSCDDTCDKKASVDCTLSLVVELDVVAKATMWEMLKENAFQKRSVVSILIEKKCLKNKSYVFIRKYITSFSSFPCSYIFFIHTI